MSRVVNLTTLAPDIIAAILDETLPEEVTLFDLAAGTPVLWEDQRGRVRSERAPAMILSTNPGRADGKPRDQAE